MRREAGRLARRQAERANGSNTNPGRAVAAWDFEKLNAVVLDAKYGAESIRCISTAETARADR